MFWSKKKRPPPTKQACEVTFEYLDPQAKHVQLCADFNSWNAKANPLVLEEKGRWRLKLRLEPGRYEYRFLVDGEWKNDQRPVYLVDNPFGSQNCIIEI